MIKLSFPILAATLVATTAIALADEKSDLVEKLEPYINAPRYFDEFGWNEEKRFDPEAAPCMQIVDKLRALGVDSNDEFAGYMAETWRFKQAPELCQRYREYQWKIRGANAVEPVAGLLQRKDTDSNSWYGVEKAETCVKELDALIVEGLPRDAMIRLGYDKEIKVADAREGCAALLARSTEEADKKAKEAEAAERAEAARWAKLGVSGNRLELIQRKNAMTVGGPASFYIKGCEHTSDPKKLAKAKVLREIYENDDGLTIDVRSHFFKGNKLLKSTRAALPRGSMHAACK